MLYSSDKVLNTSILSDLIQCSIFILPHIEITHTSDKGYLDNDAEKETPQKDSINFQVKRQ